MITRRIDEQGRICIPLEFRRYMGLKFDDEIELEIHNGNILITGAKQKCIICSNKTDNKIHGKYICQDCLNSLADDNIRT